MSGLTERRIFTAETGIFARLHSAGLGRRRAPGSRGSRAGVTSVKWRTQCGLNRLTSTFRRRGDRLPAQVSLSLYNIASGGSDTAREKVLVAGVNVLFAMNPDSWAEYPGQPVQ